MITPLRQHQRIPARLERSEHVIKESSFCLDAGHGEWQRDPQDFAALFPETRAASVATRCPLVSSVACAGA